jgi:hypothetical protein
MLVDPQYSTGHRERKDQELRDVLHDNLLWRQLGRGHGHVG